MSDEGAAIVAYSEELAARIREVLAEDEEPDERKMFGGLAFMVNGNMCCGVIAEDLMLRLGDKGADQAVKKQHVRPMDFTGRPLKGYVFVGPSATKTEAMLSRWVGQARNFVRTLPPK